MYLVQDRAVVHDCEAQPGAVPEGGGGRGRRK